VVLRVACRGDGRLDDVVRGGEVRLAHAETDDRTARGLQRLGLGIDGESGGFSDGGDALGDAMSHNPIISDASGGFQRLRPASMSGTLRRCKFRY
jgi:hypothetical protein